MATLAATPVAIATETPADLSEGTYAARAAFSFVSSVLYSSEEVFARDCLQIASVQVAQVAQIYGRALHPRGVSELNP